MLSIAKQNVPSPGMPVVMLKLTAWFSATAPSVEMTAPSMTGWLFQLVVNSGHAQLVMRWICPPLTLWALATVDTRRLRSAEVTVRAPTLLTWMRRKVRLMPGPASTLSRLLLPRLLVGVSEATDTSARTVATAGAGGAGQVHVG